jgi:PadR family transcriptional regulator AphA
MAARELTTTSYVLLSQLALRPWTAYGLATEMDRNLRYFWPRARRGVYAELKDLADAGLASSQSGGVGRRPRTTYAITEAGRAALDRWLSSAPRGVNLEAESVVRVFVAHLGTRDQLLAAIDAVRVDAEDLLARRPVIGDEYLSGQAPFQEFVHTRAFVFDFLAEFAIALKQWAVRTRAEVLRWEDVELSPDKRNDALRLIASDMGRDAS